MEEVDVFVTDPTTLDLEVYDLWLKGFTEQEATEHQKNLQHVGATSAIIASDIADQYRVFLILEHFLQTPTLLATQLMLQIPSDVQDRLIERYYEFDNIIVRELLGKKLTTRLRKDLDDISERTNVPLKSCKRQYDNIKNIFKAVEDSTGDSVNNIKTEFLLSEKLSKFYACIVFMSYHKFETGKRRLSHLTFADCAHCVDHMITNWTINSSGNNMVLSTICKRCANPKMHEPKTCAQFQLLEKHKSLCFLKLHERLETASKESDLSKLGGEEKSITTDVTDSDTALDMDKNFLQELRDLRTFSSDKDIADEHKRAVFAELKTKASKEIAKMYDHHVKNFDRILINIGAGLIHQKDMKDIFLDLVEKFIEPCKQLNLTVSGLSMFLQALMTTCEKLSSVQKAGLSRLIPVYIRYLTVVHKCIVRIYPAL